jgi:hypothetical protein
MSSAISGNRIVNDFSKRSAMNFSATRYIRLDVIGPVPGFMLRFRITFRHRCEEIRYHNIYELMPCYQMSATFKDRHLSSTDTAYFHADRTRWKMPSSMFVSVPNFRSTFLHEHMSLLMAEDVNY